jgi:hypothetical protein
MSQQTANDETAAEALWHHRHTKAYYPIETDDDHVVMVSAWHPEELADARESGALVPADDVRLDRVDTTFNLVDSFRFLEEETVAAVREALDA